MVKLSPYGLSVAVVAGTSVLIGAGAAVTSSPAAGSYKLAHQSLAVFVAILTVILALTLWRTRRRLGLSLIGFVLLLGLPVGDLASFRVFHACLAHGFFALSWIAAVVTSSRWAQGPSIVQDGGFPSLRSLSVFAAAVTAFQVGLGAGFRHGTMSVVPHVVGAIVTTVVLLVLATFVLTQFPKHTALCRAAWHSIGVVTLQIGLGVVAFVARLNHVEGSVPSGALVASTVAHVIFGAFTFASTLVLALQVRYHVRPRAAFESGIPVAS